MKKLAILALVLFSLSFISACPYSTNSYDNAISVNYDQNFVETHYVVENHNTHNQVVQNVHHDTNYNSNYDYVYETRDYQTNYQQTYQSNYVQNYSPRATAQPQKLPLVYYGMDRGFIGDSQPLSEGTPTNIRMSDSSHYLYKYTPYFGGYYEAFKCYDSPPENKLFYTKCT